VKIKKLSFVFSFALATLLVVGQAGFAEGSDNNGMGNMMNGNGMSNMMENGNMSNMMNAMNSPKGQEMMNACGDFMESYEDEKETK
jgi:hypothetical protein